MTKLSALQTLNSTNVRTLTSPKNWLQKSFELAYRSHPQLCSKIFTEYLFHPPLLKERKMYTEWEQKSQKTMLALPGTNHFIQTYKWGEGPAVLLVHGWAGRGLQLYSFIQPLIERGYSVVTFDAPAHGQSTGVATNYFEFHLSIHAVVKHFKDIDTIIGHSMGGASAIKSLAEFGLIKNMIVIASQFDMESELNQWAEKSFLGSKNFQSILKYLEQKYQMKLQDMNPKNIEISEDTRLLIVHDKEDIPCDYSNGVLYQTRFPQAELYTTSGLGHYKIIRTPYVVRKIVEFIDPLLLN